MCLRVLKRVTMMETGENQTLLNSRESRGCCIRCCRSCCVGCVCSKGILLLLTWSVLIHSFGYYMYFQFLSSVPSFVYLFIAMSVVQAVVFLLYPVAGLMGEVCLSRYKLMIVGTILALIGIFIAVPTLTMAIFNKENDYLGETCKKNECMDYPFLVPACVSLVIYQFGLGLFEANAIQFGTDQLQFASNEKLSVFVNWYFWSLYIVNSFIPVTYVIGLGISSAVVYIPFLSSGVAILGLFSFISISIMLFCCCGCHSHFTTEPVGRINPVKHIITVLNYARHHSQAVFRSAFTYGEVPSRLDLAKDRYGGPFTTEEVEDVKTFGRILLVLISLFGFLLLPSTMPSLIILKYYAKLSTGYRILFGVSYCLNILNILPALLIPVHMLIIRPCFNRYTYRISILNKMGTGLVLVVLSLGLMTPVDVSLYEFIESVNSSSYDISLYSTFNESGSPPNYILPVIIVSQFLNGLSLILVFLSALEFILAQGPRSMQGLLIGLWYAYQSVYVLLQIPALVLQSYQPFDYQLIITVLKTCLAVLSLIVFIIISRWYKYRQREESSEINRQAIIEEYTERQLITAREAYDYDNEYNYLSDYSCHTIN